MYASASAIHSSSYKPLSANPHNGQLHCSAATRHHCRARAGEPGLLAVGPTTGAPRGKRKLPNTEPSEAKPHSTRKRDGQYTSTDITHELKNVETPS